MRDMIGNGDLQVQTSGTAGPYIVVDHRQLWMVNALLGNAAIPFTVSLNTLAGAGIPPQDTINLGTGANVAATQAILDSAPPLRPANADRTVLVLSKFLPNGDRECPRCHAHWNISFATGMPVVHLNGQPSPQSLLDWDGNNGAVECCVW